MKNIGIIIGLIVIVGIGLYLFSATSTEDTGTNSVVTDTTAESDVMEKSNTVVDVAKNTGTFNTLVAALEATSLDETLAGEGPFTVFAPTDDAFAKLPEGTVESLLNDLDQLSDILLYHVVAGEVLAKDVVTLNSATTLNGTVTINTTNGVKVNDANVVTTDIKADNGVIHVIDSVLLP